MVTVDVRIDSSDFAFTHDSNIATGRQRTKSKPMKNLNCNGSIGLKKMALFDNNESVPYNISEPRKKNPIINKAKPLTSSNLYL